MITLNIDYEKAIDFGHIDDLHEAGRKLSELTNLLNIVISVRHRTKQDIILECAKFPENKPHKLSWENKLVMLLQASPSSSDMVNLYSQADEAYIKIRNKQSQVLEDLMALKKIIDTTPR